MRYHTLHCESINEDSSKKFVVPIEIENIKFTSFQIKIATRDSIAKIKDVLSREGTNFKIDKISDYSAIIKFESKLPYTTDSDYFLKIVIKPDESYVDNNILEVQEAYFYNNGQQVDIDIINKKSTAFVRAPLITKDTIVFGLLMLALGFVFITESIKSGFWSKFYKIVPGLFIAYMLPAVLTTSGLISPEWESISEDRKILQHGTSL